MGDDPASRDKLENGVLRARIAELELAIERHQRERQAHRESEARYRSLFEHANDAIYLIRPATGEIVDCNRQAAAIDGYTIEELRRMTAADLHPADELEILPKEFKEVSARGSVFGISGLHHLRKDGALVPIEVNATTVELEGETLNMCIVRDVSERRRTERALRLTQFSVDHASDAVFWMGPDARFVYVNEMACRSLGYSRQELLAMTVHDIDPDFPAEAWPDHWSKLQERGSSVFESHHRAKGGRVFPVEISANLLEFEGREYHCAFARDISSRKCAEGALERSERDYRGLFENAHDAVLIFRPEDEVVLDVNPRACAMYGFSRSEFVGMSLETISKDVPRGKQYLRETTRNRVRHGFETVQYRKDGTEMLLEVNAAVVEYRGQHAMLTINRDITERKRVEEELTHYRNRLEELVDQRTRELESSREQLRRAERLASLGTLSAGIAHEINNPVGMILMAAENAIAHKEHPDAEGLLCKCLDDIVASAERCGRITKSILQFAREQGTEKAPADLNMIIEHAVLLTRKYVKEHGGTIELRLAKRLPPVLMNRVEMEQSLVNLIRNAVDAGSRGVRIVIRTEEACSSVRMAVKDDGPGVAQDHLKHLFDPFFTTRREEGGTGLGLSIVHGIITGHGGTINVESQPGTGTVFMIELPRASRAEPEVLGGQSPDR